MRQHLGIGGVLGRQLANGVDVRRILSAELAQQRLLLLADRSCTTARTKTCWAPALNQVGDSAPTISRQMPASAWSRAGGGAGRSPGRAGGTTASDTADLRPRAIRTLPFDAFE